MGDSMIETILAITKYFVLFLGIFYGYFKLAKTKLNLINLIDVFFAAILAVALYYATKQLRLLIPALLLILSCLYIFIRVRRSFITTVSLCVISCGITNIIIPFSFLISVPVDFIVYVAISDEIIQNCIAISASSAFQILFTLLIYRIKRFRSGIAVQNNDGNVELLLLLSILSVFLLTLFYADNILESYIELFIIILIFCGLYIFVLWKKHITNTYHTKIQKRNEALYEHRIEKYENERAKLLDQNAKLAKIIHRDNKLIPAMVMAVKELIGTAPENEELKSLLEQLNELSTEHRDIIDKYQANSDELPKTGVIPIDAVLHFISSKAKQDDIEFNVVISNGIEALTSQVTDMTDLTTVLCDLGENAIIATRHSSNGNVLITFENSESDAPRISFWDNGPLFDEKVIANMGKRKITTHKNEGGSGIGLMTLFEMLNKYNASFCLDERQKNGFTKCIRLTFDNLHKIDIIR